MANEVKYITRDDIKHGYYVLACGCHAFVFRAELAERIDPAMVECCGGMSSVVRLSHIEELTKGME